MVEWSMGVYRGYEDRGCDRIISGYNGPNHWGNLSSTTANMDLTVMLICYIGVVDGYGYGGDDGGDDVHASMPIDTLINASIASLFVHGG